MYKVLKPFRDEDAGKTFSRGIVASTADFGGEKAVERLIKSGCLTPYTEDGSPVLSGKENSAARIATLEAENESLRAQLLEFIAARQHPFETINGIGHDIAIALQNAGFNSMDEIRDADDDRLLAIAGIGKSLLKKIRGHFQAEE
jgi:predicted flap endonuclease-1-like 5' DNA nuclease